MYKVDNLYLFFSSKRVSSSSLSAAHPFHCICLIFLFCIVTNIYAQNAKPVLAILGLDNSGGISETVIDTICNRISALIEKKQKYYVFQREFILPVLNESGFTVTNGTNSQIDELIRAGTFLSADEIIGGSIFRVNGNLNLSLIRIDVTKRIKLSSLEIRSDLSKQDFLEFELPRLVDNIITNLHTKKDSVILSTQDSNNPFTNIENEGQVKIETTKADKSIISDNLESKNLIITEKHRRRAPVWILMSGIALAGAVTGAYLYHEKMESDNSDNSSDIPLSELPVRTRNP